MARPTHVIGFTSTTQPSTYSVATVLLYPTIYMSAWLQQPGPCSPICLPIPSALGQNCACSSRPTSRRHSIGQEITRSLPGSSRRIESRYENTFIASTE
ncbi:hypothetical protein PR202_gn00701 [Eleusine coracana subsp. coracana]|uniref:Uncharacterized protein n=1 Tax=Eleusine coracana subsp. coracana TaxID=191504 RepID=A0AAV5G0A9_ELECO|nr:hypothetical protein PR202_gn00701 [Eleusine coracana subsp. coracana]